MIVPPGLSAPERSASSIIESAMRSLIEAPGLARSCLIQTSASPNRRLIADVRRVADRFEDVGGLHGWSPSAELILGLARCHVPISPVPGALHRRGMRCDHRAWPDAERTGARRRSTAAPATMSIASGARRPVHPGGKRMPARLAVRSGSRRCSRRRRAGIRPRRSVRSGEEIQILRYDEGGHFAHLAYRRRARRDRAAAHLRCPSSSPRGAIMTAASWRLCPIWSAGRGRCHSGSAQLFPSRALHRVTPVTRGTRWALVAWTGRGLGS